MTKLDLQSEWDKLMEKYLVGSATENDVNRISQLEVMLSEIELTYND